MAGGFFERSMLRGAVQMKGECLGAGTAIGRREIFLKDCRD